MSRRSALVISVVVILTAGSLVILALVLTSQGLDRAAAWSNILALPVGIVGLAVGALGLRQGSSNARNSLRVTEAGSSYQSQPGASPVVQLGIGDQQINAAGNATINIHNQRG